MTSADVPGVELERTIELSSRITGLAVNDDTPANPLLIVYFEQRSPVIIVANTGAHFEDYTNGLYFEGKPQSTQQSLTMSDLLVQAENTDIVVTSASRATARRLAGHSSRITTLGLYLSGTEPLLMSGSEGGSLRIWNPHTGELIRRSQPSPVSALITFPGPDGRPRIASGDKTGKLRIWNPHLPAVLRIGPVATRGFSDRVAAHDLLNRGSLVQALVQLLKPGEDDSPTVITIEGAWGSGKSTLLDFVREELAVTPDELPIGRRLTVLAADRMLFQPPLREESSWKRPDKPLVAMFNPWRHQSSEQVWAGLATAVAEAAEPAIMPDQNSKERYWFAKNAARVDRRHLQRQLWKRIYSPLLSFAGFGFGLSALGALTKLNITWGWWVTASLAGLGLLHTARRYFFGRASAFLPGELFAGPVASNAFSGSSTDPLIRDPYYHAKSGYLYLVQHDVKVLLEDLADKGYQLVLLIDDLDRCTPRTTAQVFEAINVFLADDFPDSRFVLGLDSSVVASHVDHAYKELADAKVVAHPDDPSPGWTFLRKLVQLPVRLPPTSSDDVDRLLLSQLGPVHQDGMSAVVKKLAIDDLTTTELADVLWLAAAVKRQPDAAEIEEIIVSVERHAEVREHLRRRLRSQPEQSVREEKRLLNVWQFYLRVLGSSDVEQACQLVAVAEISVRWPAYLHRLRGGWQELADAVGDDVQWGATIAKLGFAYSDRKAVANLRALLRDCDAQAVAGLADQLF
ncbi:P-loop NTPase fold protein [Lentzea sp. NPDC054927]